MKQLLARTIAATLALLALGALALVSTAPADPRYEVMNAPEGVYWRSEPNWAAAERITGFGVYNGTIVEVHCYQSGTAVEGSADTMWEQATDVGGSGYGSGWLNEHFINDGQPIDTPSPEVPACNTPPPTAPSSPSSSPQGLVYPIFNAEGGIYYRNSPHWADTSATPGVGVYNGDQVELICGAFGDAVGPFNDTAWSYVNNLSRSVGDGWVSEHFINDGAPDNAFVSGEPMCGPDIPGASTSGDSGESGSGSVSNNGGSAGSSNGTPTPALGASLYYSPFSDNRDRSPADRTIGKGTWNGNTKGCPAPKLSVPTGEGSNGIVKGRLITTLAAWSVARTAPILFLLARPAWRYQIHYILLFDPANRAEYVNSPCTHKYGSTLSLTLASWLAHDPSNKLVILAGELTADYSHPDKEGHGHAGLQEVLFPKIKAYPPIHGRSIRTQVVVCNYDQMNHEGVWDKFKQMMNQPPITLHTCPPEPGYFPVRPAPGWNP